MFEYFNKIRKILEKIEVNEKNNIELVIKEFENAIIENRKLFVFGASHAGIISQEMFYRAGGLITINPIFSEELMLNTSPITHTSNIERLEGYGTLLGKRQNFNLGDILLVHSVSGRNNVTIELVKYAKLKGVKIIAITNLNYSKSVKSKDSSNLNLYQIADIVIDNHGEIGDACIKIGNLEQKVAPTSTVIGACIVNHIVSKTVERLYQNNYDIPIFYSANLDGGMEKNSNLMKKYKNIIEYKF